MARVANALGSLAAMSDEAFGLARRSRREIASETVDADQVIELLLKSRAVTNVFVDFHPECRFILPLQQAPDDPGLPLQRVHQRSELAPRLFRALLRDAVIDVEMRRRGAHAIRPRGAAAGDGKAYGSATRSSAGPSGPPRRTSPRSCAPICTVASMSQPPCGAGEAFTTVPHG